MKDGPPSKIDCLTTSRHGPDLLRGVAFYAAFLLFGLIGLSPLTAQENDQNVPPEFGLGVPVEAEDSETSGSYEAANGNSFVSPPREMLRLLEQAETLANEERYVDAVRCIAAVLEDSTDYFLPSVNGTNYPGQFNRTARSEAVLLLSRMPSEALRSYELQYGIAARRDLEEAARNGDMKAVSKVVGQAFHTEAGYEASLMLGLHELSVGRHLAAALTLRRLKEQGPSQRFEPTLSLALAVALSRSGDSSGAIDVLIALRDAEGGRPLAYRGTVRPFFAERDEAIDWLIELFGAEPAQPVHLSADVDWTMHRAAPERNASIEAGTPLLMPTWSVPTVEYPVVQAMIDELRYKKDASAQAMLPSSFPIAVDGIVLFRTLHELLAIDLQTGKRLWTVKANDPFESYAGPDDGPDAIVQLQRMRGQRLELGLRCRMWGDTLYGTISSDGDSVYSIEGLRFPTGQDEYQVVLVALPGGQQRMERLLTPAQNELAAHDVRTGERLWRVGGDESLNPSSPLAGYYFLGAPLPWEGVLYVLAEKGTRIYLLAIDPLDGTLAWELPLSNVDREISNSPLRRIVGLTPSASGGMLVCPTGHGTIAAVDPLSRSLIWGFAYDLENASRNVFGRRGQRFQVNPDPSGRWTDASLILGENCVIATPPDSPDLYCLDLISGRLRWTTSRSRWNAIFVACVHDGKVLLASSSELVALSLEDGRSLWQERPLRWKPGAHPSGQGFLSGDEYLAPLSNGTVERIDLKQGEIVGTIRTRSDVVPGNLIQNHGCIVSQRGDSIEAFYQRERLERITSEQLEVDPNNPETLTLRGRIAWSDARFADAIADLRDAYAISQTEAAQRSLRDLLFDTLQNDFVQGVPFIDEMGSLLNSSDDRILLCRLLVEGYVQRNDGDAAMQSLLALFDEFEETDLNALKSGSFHMASGRKVRRDRWIDGIAGNVYDIASNDARQDLDAFIQRRFDNILLLEPSVLDTGKYIALMESLHAWSSGLPSGESIRRKLVDLYSVTGNTVKLGLLLEANESKESESEIAELGATIAQYHESREEWGDAEKCYNCLIGNYGDVSRVWGDSDGELETAREYATSRLMTDPIHEAKLVRDWPQGRVDFEWSDIRTPRPPDIGNSLGVVHVRTPSPYFTDVRFFAPYRPNLPFTAVDDYGNSLWEFSLNESAVDFSHPSGFPVQVATLGRLLIVYVNSRIAAIDTSCNPPRMLWSRDAISNSSQVRAQSFSIPWNPPPVHPRPTTKEFSSVVALPNVVCFSHFGKLIAVDPFSGEELWSHAGPRTITGLFGGKGRIFLVERTTLEDRIAGPDMTIRATAFRASDGAPLGERRIPRDNQAVQGARILTRVFPMLPSGSPIYSTLDPPDVHFSPEIRELPDASAFPVNETPVQLEEPETPEGLEDDPETYALRLIDPWQETTEERIVWEQSGFDRTGLMEIYDRRIVVTANSDGQIRLFRLEDGRLMSRFQIDLSRAGDAETPPLHGLRFWRTSEGYMLLLIANADEISSAGDKVRIQPLGGVTDQRINVGFLMALDREGVPLWSESTLIRNTYWQSDVPSGFPFVLFGAHVVGQSPARGMMNFVWFLGVDCRTGRIIFDTYQEESPYNIQWQSDLGANTIDLFIRSQHLTLTFTDEEPVPVEHSRFFTDVAGNRPFGAE
jgi:outer membrane protein assembly factor BamB